METQRSGRRDLYLVYSAKVTRVFFSGFLSVAIASNLAQRSQDSDVFVGLALIAILGGGAVSNLFLTFMGGRIARRRSLQLFSLLTVFSGMILFFSPSPALILTGLFLGNISTTGTEAGPYQSVEAGVLPELAGGKAAKAYGTYNVLGYAAAAVGAQAVSFGGIPGFFDAVYLGFAGEGVFLLLVYQVVSGLDVRKQVGAVEVGDPAVKREILVLSLLFSADAFGGTFVSQFLLSTWFIKIYGLDLSALGALFAGATIITAFSIFLAPRVAARMGNLRTMVSTHLVSSAFLILVPLAGALPLAIAFLFLRQCFSQMDVPARQALMAEMFKPEDRVSAYATTNIARTGGGFAGGPVAAALLASGFVTANIYLGGLSKMGYDVAIFLRYRNRYQ